MPAVTPSGSRRMMLVKPFSYSPPDLPSRWRAAPAKKRRLSMMNGTSAPETEIGLPTSSASSFVRVSMSASIASARANIIAERSFGGVSNQTSSKAFCAASAARSASSRVPIWTISAVSPFEGLMFGSVSPLPDPTPPAPLYGTSAPIRDGRAGGRARVGLCRSDPVRRRPRDLAFRPGTNATEPSGKEVAVRDTYDLYIDGAWVMAGTEDRIPVIDPSTGEQVATTAAASAPDVKRAVDSASEAFRDGRWSRIPPADRARVLLKVADLIEDRLMELSKIESIDAGKPIKLTSNFDVPFGADNVRFFGGAP